MKGLSFKKNPHPTGLAGVAEPYDTHIVKWQKKECGSIRYGVNNSCHPDGDNKWRITISIRNGDGWRFITFKTRFDTSDEAKVWLHEKWEQIMKQYQIYQFEE